MHDFCNNLHNNQSELSVYLIEFRINDAVGNEGLKAEIATGSANDEFIL